MSVPRFELHITVSFPHDAGVPSDWINHTLNELEDKVQERGGDFTAAFARTTRQDGPTEAPNHPGRVVRLPQAGSEGFL